MAEEKLVVATLRVTPGMRDWMKAAGSEAVRGVIGAAMGCVIREDEAALSTGGSQAEIVSDKEPEPAPVVEEARNTPVKEERVIRPKRAKAAPAVIQDARPGIPTDPAERAAWFEAKRKESEAKAARVAAYKAGLNPIHRRLVRV